MEWDSGVASGDAGSGWETSYSPFSPAKGKASGNFSDFLVKGLDSLGSVFGDKGGKPRR